MTSSKPTKVGSFHSQEKRKKMEVKEKMLSKKIISGTMIDESSYIQEALIFDDNDLVAHYVKIKNPFYFGVNLKSFNNVE